MGHDPKRTANRRRDELARNELLVRCVTVLAELAMSIANRM